jgi:hypothetical protein
VPLVSTMIRLFEYTGRRERISAMAAELVRIGAGAARPVAELLVAAEGALAPGAGAAAIERLAAAEIRVEAADPSPYFLSDIYVYGVALRLAAGTAADVDFAIRRAQRMLDRFPSLILGAGLKRLSALAACREGRLGHALPLLEASIATFTAAGDVPEAAIGRNWLATVKYELEATGAEALVEASEEECSRLGIVRFPPELAFGDIDPSAPESIANLGALAPRAAGLAVPLERLSVRGASPAVLRRELVAVASEIFPGATFRIEDVGPGAATAAPDGPLSIEFGDGRGARLRLVAGGPIPDGAIDVLRVLVTVAALSIELATLRAAPSVPAEPELPALDVPDVPGLVGASPAIRRLRQEIGRLRASRATVILQGESGTGKEVLARALHELSSRSRGPYVTFNCAAIPRELFEGQLFGYRRGAFTGAHADHGGVIRAANGGTLFLDEIGELPLDLQPKLLRFLENREILPLGETRPIEVDVRTVAATHRDLAERVRAGTFREDLYYRLQVVPLVLPPLRERPEDVAPLARHFVRALTPDGEPPVLPPETLALLAAHDWPGNVRELRNVIERSLAFSPGARVLGAAQLRLDFRRGG